MIVIQLFTQIRINNSFIIFNLTWGCIVGAIFITVIWDLTREYYQYQLIIFGMVMMITVIYFPIGIGGYYDRFFITKKFIKNQKESIEKIRKLENENT